MKYILANLVLEAIDGREIPGLDYFDTEKIYQGQFAIVLETGERILVQVSQEDPT